jgi:hypothetical protein
MSLRRLRDVPEEYSTTVHTRNRFERNQLPVRTVVLVRKPYVMVAGGY